MSTATANRMPAINLASVELTADERAIAELILNKGHLRASKPKIEYVAGLDRYGRKIRKPVGNSAKAAYVWRMVAFQISPIGQHHCMPMTADFDLPEDDYQLRREMAKELDKLVNKITDCVPKSEWHGIRRWSSALYGR